MQPGIETYLPQDAVARRREPVIGDKIEWATHAQVRIDGRPFDLSNSPWMIPLYRDPARVKVIQKGTQSRCSVFALTTTLHGADQLGQRWIYFLPTDDETDDFVKDRVNTYIRASAYLAARVGDTDNTGLKKIGPREGVAYFRGLWTKRQAKSVPADGLAFDEVDEHKPENIAFGEGRVLESRWQYKLFLSVPSFTKYGINKLFLESDAHYYLHKCPACGEWNSMDKDWEHCFIPVARVKQRTMPDGATHYRGCKSCGRKLDMREGEWVAEHPGRPTRGYLVSRLFSLTCPPDAPNVATYIMAELAAAQGDTIRLGRFIIEFRGQPYDGDGARINDELLRSLECDEGFYYRGTGCVFGMDQGDRLHVSIYLPRTDRRLQLVYCERTESWGRAHDLFERFGCYAGALDGKPGRNDAKKFAAKYPGKVYVQDFGGTGVVSATQAEETKKGRKKGKKQSGDKVLLYDGRISVPWFTRDRTDSLDATVDFVESGRLILPNRDRLTGKDLAAYEEYRENLMMLKSKIEDTPSGRRKIYLDKVPNHHGMGLNSARIAAFELHIKRPVTGTAPIVMGWRGRA